MLTTEKLINTRDEYIDSIRRELMGPGSEIINADVEHEIISSSPSFRYSIGILFPQGSKNRVDDDEKEMLSEPDDTSENDIDESEYIEKTIDRKNIQKSNINQKEDFDEEQDNRMDEQVSMASQNKPSSMGLSFISENDLSSLVVNVRFGVYRKCTMKEAVIPFAIEEKDNSFPSSIIDFAAYDKQNGTLRLTKMIEKKKIHSLKTSNQLGNEEWRIADALYKLIDIVKDGYYRIPLEENVTVEFCDEEYVETDLSCFGLRVSALKKKLSAGYSITIMLVNMNEMNRVELTAFQPVMTVESAENGDLRFVDFTNNLDFKMLDEEEQALELLYRNKKTYCSGLGASCDWDIDDNGRGKVYTEFFPVAEVPSMDFGRRVINNKEYSQSVMSMKYLSDLSSVDKSSKLKELNAFVEVYAEWISTLRNRIVSLEPKYERIASKNVEACEKVLSRMYSGLALLEKNHLVWDAFILANRAMFMQRVHLKIQSETSNVVRYPDDKEMKGILSNLDYRSEEGYTKDEYYWRPFQLAFLLMSVVGAVSRDSTDRNEVDLIWFPTGGGKTEAYLGLTAFVIFYRRMTNSDAEADGTAVIMRYTLRLLAAQQFLRASTLICACEYIRRTTADRKRYGLGEKEITIGLWIGGTHTPNRNYGDENKRDYQANELLKILNDSKGYNLQNNLDKYNKFQLIKCPWCGTKLTKGIKNKGNSKELIGKFGYSVTKARGTQIMCTQDKCTFGGFSHLPIRVVDEDLYNSPPTLLFSTVDKFALMPWKSEVGAFLGVGRPNKSPDLIIQDELHLISGPLGTIVGLYESVLDRLCDNVKIIASTATIRRAAEQCASLYNRRVNQFPPPGIDSDDSYFAYEKKIDYSINSYGRKYVGLMPFGRTKATMEVRSISALLQSISDMELSDDVRDKFWTLVVYFNSLRDLGKCTTLIEDDVYAYMNSISLRSYDKSKQRYIRCMDLLSSRVSTTDLNKTLDRLEKNAYSKDNIQYENVASDIALATNMISVGLDVARLNSMLMIGQPKLTSEYIQASSRVGRSFPGVAFIMYDASKSRDRSFYEKFISYHSSFYKFVEPTGATPFSKPACDRALHAALITLLRYENFALGGQGKESGAQNFNRETYNRQIEELKHYFIERSSEIANSTNPDYISNDDYIEEIIDRVVDIWEGKVDEYGEKLTYGTLSPHPLQGGEGRLMKVFGSAPSEYDTLETMSSMRSVDATIPGYIIIWEE